MNKQTTFELALLKSVRQGQKIEVVRVTKNLLGHVGVEGWEGTVEVGVRLPFPLVQVPLHHVG